LRDWASGAVESSTMVRPAIASVMIAVEDIALISQIADSPHLIQRKVDLLLRQFTAFALLQPLDQILFGWTQRLFSRCRIRWYWFGVQVICPW
jgi:hypothetical protein